MAGNVSGGKVAAQTNRKRYGRDYYRNIGAKVGAASGKGGFGQGEAGKARARVWGKLGGSIGRPNGKRLTPQEKERKRKEFAKTYEHLLKVHVKANAGQNNESRLG